MAFKANHKRGHKALRTVEQKSPKTQAKTHRINTRGGTTGD